MNQTTFALRMGHEIHHRLLWFEKLRFLAAGGLVVTSLIGPRFGFPTLWPSLLIAGVFVAAYNLVFLAILRGTRAGGHSHAFLRMCVISQITLDLATLLIVVHLTGGMYSPVLLFFILHMAIGTTMLKVRTMYTIAAGACLGVFGLHLAESLGLLVHRPLTPDIVYGRGADLNVIPVLVAVFGTVYLAGTVTRRSRKRGVQLLEATIQLDHRTAELNRVVEKIQEVERTKSHYMRISAHQLRSPLGTIKTSLEVLTKGFADPTSARGQKLLNGAVERADGLLAIVTDLLELAKIREGQAKAPWSRHVNISQLLNGVLESLKPAAQSREVSLIPHMGDPAALNWGVPPDLCFAFENLIQNAIKYSRHGGEVNVTLRSTSERVTIEVADNGIGIPAELQADVFLEFVRAPNAKRHTREGTGLGLPIAKEVVVIHGGNISLVSRDGEGTTITLELPLHNQPPTGEGILDEMRGVERPSETVPTAGSGAVGDALG
ncbi:sensor histidine kinase [Candidatus Eisenbacteria bacterium]|uniref:histidine kinase n=1 Tax=Eiseniibacteriota bacterium TaxID=2212470 RepID=A0ABV6YIW9_UNCEI